MFPEPVSSIVTLVVVVLVAAAGAVAIVRRVLRALRLRHAPATGLLRAGAPGGTGDPGEAARRADGRLAWMRTGGGL